MDATVKVHSRGLLVAELPSAVVASAGTVRRCNIGPSPRPAFPTGIAFTEVHESPSQRPANAAAPADPNAPDTAAVALCRRGELPPNGWSSKWSAATKRAALLGALEDAQMHVVYALRPQSDVWQQSVQAVELEQAELDRLLREKVAGKPRQQRPRVKEAIHWLLEAGASLEALCGDKDFDVRGAAAGLLANLGAEAGGAQAAQLLKSEDWQVRTTAAEALGRLGRDAASHGEALAALLGDGEAPVRMAATAALGKLGAAAAKFCVTALQSSKARQREAACEALGMMGPSAAEHGAALAELLQDSDWQVPTAAANALKRLGPSAASHCATVLGRCEPLARAPVAEALVRLGRGQGGIEAAESLLPLLRSPEQGVRKYAAECLGSLGAEIARDYASALLPLKEDGDREVRSAAKQALVKLGLYSGLPQQLGNGDDMPPPPEHRDQRGKGRGKGGAKGARDRSRSPQRLARR